MDASKVEFARSRKGFSLVELLVVIAIILILAALIFTGSRSAMEAAHTATCASNMRQIGVGLGGYQSDFGRYPSKADGISWDRAILPYMGYDGDIELTGQQAFSSRRSKEMEQYARQFQCNSDRYERSNRNFKRSYAIVPWTTNWSNGTTFRGWASLEPNVGVPFHVLEDPTTSAVVVEWHEGTEGTANHFGSGAHAYHDRGGPDYDGRNVHRNRQNVLFADGHIEILPFIPNKEFVDKYWPGSIGQY